MSEDLKDRPAVLRRTPRPAPDEKVDPVDYSPAVVAPAPMRTEDPASADGGVEAVTPAAAPAPVPAPDPLQAAVDEPIVQVAAPTRQAAKPAKTSKTTANRKTTRREVTFPLSTRLSQEVIDVLYSAAEDEGISVREAIEQAIKSRWGQN
ncbi:hypothetical protein NicSoilB4_37050 (plasmid) [Arthrobacter sp. NicSoilB4]|uniref:hypothetical protein n=1 Tax=Arthrobacter sp. NicSoilB4 TaxID=2830997 RepID=UPI001CC82547|nr:hypothetical protein [Arthrobacter sp. NicSoilB4]BCW68942.1 hypothetical protein NicSoilB4_37050 [Arthrobacter sp. NicSoilB4]